MVINPEKVKAVIDYYGKIKEYPEKSYIPKFTEDFELNYKQWASFCNGNVAAGYKVVDIFVYIFPNIDLNWLIKEDIPVSADMFNLSGEKILLVQEPQEPIKKLISNEQIFRKLEEIQFQLKTVSEKI